MGRIYGCGFNITSLFYIFFYVLNKINIFNVPKILTFISIIYLVINMISFINLPLINPYDQNFQKYSFSETSNYLN